MVDRIIKTTIMVAIHIISNQDTLETRTLRNRPKLQNRTQDQTPNTTRTIKGHLLLSRLKSIRRKEWTGLRT